MKTDSARRGPRSGLLALVAAGALAAGAAADARAQGLYVETEAGFAASSDLTSVLALLNHPTRCDTLLYPPGISPPSDDPACQATEPAPSLGNVFPLTSRFAGGAAVGFRIGRVRIEAEYRSRTHGGEPRSITVEGGDSALLSKDAEWAVPPTEHLTDFRADQFFANAYFDFLNASGLTPWVGVGGGVANARARYATHFVRKVQSEYLAIAFEPDWPDEAKRAAAGTVSNANVEVSDRLPGLQVLAGFDYAAGANVRIGVEGRWSRFRRFESDEFAWVQIRSHAPVRADGTSPFTSSLELDDIASWGAGFYVRYEFR